LCSRLATVVADSPIFELVTPPSLALLVFRLRSSSSSKKDQRLVALTDPELNLLNQKLHTRLDKRSDVFLTPTMLHSNERDIYCLRFAIGNIRTTWEDVQATWDAVVEEGQAVLREQAETVQVE
jgi:aromatic-L-amino-acid decarboxylase